MSELARIRSVSALLAAKCFSDAPTPCDCRPRTQAVASAAVSSGSSEKYSKLRPPSGERLMLIPGPSSTSTPSARHSLPSAVPTRSASAGSQLCASPAAGGKQVDGSLITAMAEGPLSVVLRRPCGPSETRTAGMPPSALVCQKLAPPVSAAFSSTVSLAGCVDVMNRSLR